MVLQRAPQSATIFGFDSTATGEAEVERQTAILAAKSFAFGCRHLWPVP